MKYKKKLVIRTPTIYIYIHGMLIFASCDISSALNMAKKKYFRQILSTSLIGMDLFHIFTDPLNIMKKRPIFCVVLY